MTDPDLLDRLARHRTLGAAPREELEWLASHGTLQQLTPGSVLATKTSQADNLWVVLSGRIAAFVDRGARLRKVTEWGEGDVTGLLPYSRLVNAPNDVVAQEPTIILALHRDHLRAMIRECHEITSILVHSMLDRTRFFISSDLHDEKMVSLGKLSAGLAHELNNPASAIQRSSALLENRLEDAEGATTALFASRLTDAQIEALKAVRRLCLGSCGRGVLPPIEHIEREQAIVDWLADHGLDVGSAEALAETTLTSEDLDRLVGTLEGPALDAGLRWIAAECSSRNLASEIQEAGLRISSLVTAVKGFTHMDHASVAESVDLIQGLDNTVAVLKAKARGKSAAVVVDVEPGLPPVRGFVGELNQIWANLIDNALDAVPDCGCVQVRATRQDQQVVVRIVDDGTGIAPEIRGRIFDPFFTTKPVGQGTGLGLDIVRRLVRHNEGEILVESRPGRTEFRVVLQAAE